VINYKVDSYEGDFAHPEWIPIVLKNSHKVVYSVHEYPKEVGGYPGPESGPGYIDRMNKTWGRLISKNVAPVWVGEMGGVSMTSSANIAWGDTLLSYMNGRAPGGIRFTKDQQPISGDWWRWGAVPDTGDGCFDATGKMNAAQAPYIDQLLYSPR
jgi:hypothetical protein